MQFELNDYHRNVSNEELLNDVRRVAEKYQKNSMTQKEYLVYGKYGINTFRRHFKSWNIVLELCGLQVNAYQAAAAKGGHNYAEVTTEELIYDLQRVARLLKVDTFSSCEYGQYGDHSTGTYFNRFGTWNKALERAGLKEFHIVSPKRIEEEKLLVEIERIWIKLGRQPTTTDIKNGVSKYSLNTFTRRFGSWRRALEYFVTYINEEELSELGSIECGKEENENSRTIERSLSHKEYAYYKLKLPTPIRCVEP